jgi:hypothetical protein
MKSYLQLVSDKAYKANIKLEDAFDKAGACHTTYWRTKNNKTELKYDTALRIFNAIEELYQIQQGREYSQRLRETDQRVSRSSIRSRFKPRIISQ